MSFKNNSKKNHYLASSIHPNKHKNFRRQSIVGSFLRLQQACSKMYFLPIIYAIWEKASLD